MRSKLLLAHFRDDERDSEGLKIIVITCQDHTAGKWKTCANLEVELHGVAYSGTRQHNRMDWSCRVQWEPLGTGRDTTLE